VAFCGLALLEGGNMGSGQILTPAGSYLKKLKSQNLNFRMTKGL
jgi:hypothetical protein